MPQVLKIVFLRIMEPFVGFFYRKKIKKILKNKELVLLPRFFGLGDILSFSSLPELIFRDHGVRFYLHSSCLAKIPNDILDLCFACNPYFMGFKSSKPFSLRVFRRDSDNLIQVFERQFKLNGNGLPRIYYTPKNLNLFNDKYLVDLNFKTGKTLGHHYNFKLIDREVQKLGLNDLERFNINPKNQDIFEYIDMINSSKFAVFLFSGGSVLAACLSKKTLVFLPKQLRTEGRYAQHFIFNKNKNIRYINYEETDRG